MPRTRREIATNITNIAPTEPPTQQEVIVQIDVDVVRQFRRMLDADTDFQ